MGKIPVGYAMNENVDKKINSPADGSATTTVNESDTAIMRVALTLAAEAGEAGEVPVGAVVVRHGKVIGRGRNRRESGGGATAHAEIEAISEACRVLGGWRLSGCELYVTLEPCPMCAGAVIAARLDRVVFGAADIKGGALGGLFDLTKQPLGAHPIICGGVLEAECRALLREFFSARRAESQARPRRLTRETYSQSADLLAPFLLGKWLCRRTADGAVKRVRIKETECYLGEADTACHAHRGKTDRTRIMWQRGGMVYVYLCYGMHSMLNIISGAEGSAEAVLIRSVDGAEGPGRLTKMLEIDRRLCGHDAVFSDEIWIEDDGGGVPDYTTSPRVGIDYASPEDRARPWRFTAVDGELS